MRWLDVMLLLVAAGVVLAGPWMALQELGQQQEDWARFSLTGETPPPTTEHRDAWRFALPAMVVLVDVLATVALVRVNARRRVRSVARRPGLVMLAGLCLLDLTYFLDWAYLMHAHYLLRAPVVFVVYPIAGVVIAGSAYSLAVLEDTFAPTSKSRADRERDRSAMAAGERDVVET